MIKTGQRFDIVRTFCFKMIQFLSHTSVCLIFCPKSTADSEITRPNISKLFTVSKTSTYGMLIPKIFSSEISAIIEISINSALHTIIEYQIFCVISPIVDEDVLKPE